MDDYNTGMDPEVKIYFKKIMNSFGAGLLWMLSVGTAGFFFKLAIIRNGVQWHNLVFYLASLISLAWLIFFFYKVWGKKQ
jgi:hypothetical protein